MNILTSFISAKASHSEGAWDAAEASAAEEASPGVSKKFSRLMLGLLGRKGVPKEGGPGIGRNTKEQKVLAGDSTLKEKPELVKLDGEQGMVWGEFILPANQQEEAMSGETGAPKHTKDGRRNIILGWRSVMKPSGNTASEMDGGALRKKGGLPDPASLKNPLGVQEETGSPVSVESRKAVQSDLPKHAQAADNYLNPAPAGENAISAASSFVPPVPLRASSPEDKIGLQRMVHPEVLPAGEGNRDTTTGSIVQSLKSQKSHFVSAPGLGKEMRELLAKMMKGTVSKGAAEKQGRLTKENPVFFNKMKLNALPTEAKSKMSPEGNILLNSMPGKSAYAKALSSGSRFAGSKSVFFTSDKKGDTLVLNKGVLKMSSSATKGTNESQELLAGIKGEKTQKGAEAVKRRKMPAVKDKKLMRTGSAERKYPALKHLVKQQAENDGNRMRSKSASQELAGNKREGRAKLNFGKSPTSGLTRAVAASTSDKLLFKPLRKHLASLEWDPAKLVKVEAGEGKEMEMDMHARSDADTSADEKGKLFARTGGLSFSQMARSSGRKEFSAQLVRQLNQQSESGRPSSGSWNRHRFVMDDGKTINVSVRHADGAMQLQLGAGNSELNRVIQQHINEIRQHLQEQMNVEVDLQLQHFGHQQAGTENKDTHSETGMPVGGIEDSEGEAVVENGAGQRTVRYLGFNNNEWTA